MSVIHKISFTADNNNLLQKYNSLQQQTPTTKTVIPENNTSVSSDKLKKGIYAISATTALSLGITTLVAIKNHRLSKQLNMMGRDNALLQETANKLSTELQETKNTITRQITQNLSKLEEKISTNIQKTEDKIANLGQKQDDKINKVKGELVSQLTETRTNVKGYSLEDISLSPTIVNGMRLDLSTSLHGYGKNTESLEHTLRSESTKRIFQIVDRSNITPKDNITIRIPTSEFKGIVSTGGMSIVPKEVIANLGAIINGKQNVRLVVDTPMYLGQVEENIFYNLIKREDGLFDYISSTAKGEKPIIKGLQRIDTMTVPIHTEKGKTAETIEMFLAKDMEQVVDLELLKPWLEKGLSKDLDAAIKNGEPFEISKNALTIKYTPEKGDLRPTARVKYDAILYGNNKFLMDGPVFENNAKNIYNNVTYNSGETERFIYFDKYFYEYMLRNKQMHNDSLGADLIIGNDWQTGAISAMTRLLTPAKKAFGLEPKIADEVYNTPIITLMHNAGLAGDVHHSQAKLLNIMFGEHASMITKNAWMPQNADLTNEALNGLFHGNNFNPQTMAAVYSDIITPVSKGYGHEIASHSGFGCANHDIFRMRARYNAFGEQGHLKYLAERNGLNPDKVPETNLGYRPITNGCDRVNNSLAQKNANMIEDAIGLPKGSLKILEPQGNVTAWHLHNKEVYLNHIINEIEMARKGIANPMNIALPELTSLEGVTKNTMVVSTAGRIVDQKGLDIFAEAIEEFLTRHPKSESPVFYIQGIGDQQYIDKVLDIKRKVASKYGQKAAERIVYAKLFSEPGRYDGCKLMSDFTVMSSWFEPCGLVHKEIAGFSGAVPIVNRVGGLTDGLKDGVNAIFSEFTPKFESYESALHSNRNSFADALDKAYELFNDKHRFSQVLYNSYNTDHSWLKLNGPMQEYAQAMVDLKVLKPEVLMHS